MYHLEMEHMATSIFAYLPDHSDFFFCHLSQLVAVVC